MTSGTLVHHLGNLWRLADEATSIHVAGGGLGLSDLDEARLEAAADAELEGLRHAALLAGRARDTARWLPIALGFGESAVGLIQAAAHSGRVPGTVPARPTLPDQVAQLARLSPEAATDLVALTCARGAVAGGGHPRFVDSAQQLLASARLHGNGADGPLYPWAAQLRHTTEQLLGHVAAVLRFVASAVAFDGASVVIADPDPRARRHDLAARIPGLEHQDLFASRDEGRWTVPAAPNERTDRLVAAIREDLIGPFRAVTLDRDATTC